MGQWRRKLIFKATCIACILILLFVQFSNFRSNNTPRAPYTLAALEDDDVSKTIIDNSPNASSQVMLSDHVNNGANVDRLFASNQIGIAGSKMPIENDSFELTLNAACPVIPPDLNSPIQIDIQYEPLDVIEMRFRYSLRPGGWYKPNDCQPKERVAVIVPYRNRTEHLPIFLKNIHPLLIKQQNYYGIFVVEQTKNDLFNLAALMNVAFLEASKLNQWDCFIFHDVDLIPLDDRNLYRCPIQPRHMSVAIDSMKFKLQYSGIFGGVSAMTVEQFKTVNGFSNDFWGWTGEDDDMANRLKHVGYHISRYGYNIARYKMLKHRKETANPKRYEKLVNGTKKFDSEGLNSLKYEIHAFERRILYTWILAEVKHNRSVN